MKGSALAASFFSGFGQFLAQLGRIPHMVPWCSGLAYVPVKDEIAGSNPVGTAISLPLLFSMVRRVTTRSGLQVSHPADAAPLPSARPIVTHRR